MNTFRYIIAAIAALVSLAGCRYDESEHHFQNKIYIDSQKPAEDILFKASSGDETRTIQVRTALPAENDIEGSIAVNTDLLDRYNASYGDSAVIFPEENCIIEDGDIFIGKGSTTSVPASITFTGLSSLDRETTYALPVELTDISGVEVLDSKTVIYYVFKGASLINVVADIARNNFPVEWKSDVTKLSAITVEVLIRVRDFGTVGGEKGEAMSTIFGIEGKFLLRIGDAGFPQNQLQLVNPNGNFPEGNSQLGLPNNEWVHVAAVWDATTGDRIIYHNGKEMARDSRASGSVNLRDNCFIGKAWNDSRWLDGEISELRIWSIQRSPEELASNFYEVDPASEGLVAYWKFNEGQGKVVKDHSGNGNDITAENDLKWTQVSLPESNK